MHLFSVFCILILYSFTQVSQCQLEESVSDGENKGTDVKGDKHVGVSHADGERSLTKVENQTGRTRSSRTLFAKLHSKASFLAGLKLGSILSKKGFELGHGKIASAHTFQLFGKTVNSATSLSYGDGNSQLPTLDTPFVSNEEDPGSLRKDVYQVTVIETSPGGTIPNVDETCHDYVITTNDDEVENNGTTEQKQTRIIELHQEDKGGEESFLKEHNRIVKELNKNSHRRANSKFKTAI